MWVLALDAWQVVAHGRVWTGTDGVYIVDQLQYLAWIRDASKHLFASNLFVLRPTPADYFQPAVALSGGLSALGVVPWLSLLLWKPVAVGASFFAVRAYVRDSLSGLWSRRAGLGPGPVLRLVHRGLRLLHRSRRPISRHSSPGATRSRCWRSPPSSPRPSLYARAHEHGRFTLVPALLGAFASLLHPWHGELLILILVGAELALWRRRGRPRLALPAVTLLGRVYRCSTTSCSDTPICRGSSRARPASTPSRSGRSCSTSPRSRSPLCSPTGGRSRLSRCCHTLVADRLVRGLRAFRDGRGSDTAACV